MAQALQANVVQGGSRVQGLHSARQQLSLSAEWMRQRNAAHGSPQPPLCAGCRSREARYGFHTAGEDPGDRPRTLCFHCFRVEVGRRQDVAARMARGWDARQAPLPLEGTLNVLRHRRRRAQIAARHALGL